MRSHNDPALGGPALAESCLQVASRGQDVLPAAKIDSCQPQTRGLGFGVQRLSKDLAGTDSKLRKAPNSPL